MNRRLLLLLVTMLLMSGHAWAAAAYGSGDVNGDGKTDVDDMSAIINIMLRIQSADDYLGNPDITGNGVVDVGDMNIIINYILGRLPEPDDNAITIDGTTALSADNRIIYEMNVGAVTASGTLNGARTRLAALRTLGVDIVWLMPIYPRGGGLNSPYAPTNLQSVNPQYGTLDDLKNFVAEAHSLGMEVWLDWVPNHTATNATWVTQHPEYYVRQNGAFVNPGGYTDVYQLDYSNAALRTAMNDCLKYWIDRADIDGFRCDYISSAAIPASYWQETIPMLKNYKSGKTITMLGEADIVQDETRLLNVGFDYDYAWNFQSSQLASFGANGTSGALLRQRCQNFINASKVAPLRRMLYLINHDINFNDGGKTLADLYGENRYPLTVIEFTLYGMPMLYNGQEIGMQQKLNYFTDQRVNWSNVDAKMNNTVRTLAALRHTQAALAGDVEPTFHTTNNASVLAYTKTRGTSQVLVVMNFSSSAVNVQLTGVTAGDYMQWLTSTTIADGVPTNAIPTTLTASPTMQLEGKGYTILVRKP